MRGLGLDLGPERGNLRRSPGPPWGRGNMHSHPQIWGLGECTASLRLRWMGWCDSKCSIWLLVPEVQCGLTMEQMSG